MLNRKIYLSFLSCLFSLTVIGQPYQQVTVTSGTQTIGSITITVTPDGSASTAGSCGVSPFFTHVVCGYRYDFSPPSIAGIRSHLIELNTGEIMTVLINGNPYYVTSANLSNYSGTCSGVPLNSVIASGGDMLGTSNAVTGVQFDVIPGYAISSFELYETNASVGGTIFDLYYLEACPYTITAESDTPCTGDSLHLSANGISGTNIAYSWTGPNNFTSSLQNPAIPNAQSSNTGIYNLVVTQDTCVYNASVNVSLKPLPIISSLSASVNPVCEGSSINLFVNSNSPGATYSWHGPNGFSSQIQNPVVSNILLSDSGYYAGTVFLNGCSAKDSVLVHVNPLPSSLSFGSNSPVCTGDTIMLQCGSSLPGVFYHITSSTLFNSTSQNALILNASLSDAGYYYLSASLNGCSAYDTLAVAVNPRPYISSVGSNSPVCADSSLQLSATAASSGLSYQWTGPNNFSSSNQNPLLNQLSLSSAGNYKVSVTLNGCSSEDSLIVIVNPLPSIPLVSNNGPVCVGSIMQLTATDSTPGVSYSWLGPNSFSSSLQNPSVSNTVLADSGFYTVTTILNGCRNTAFTQVEVLPIPGPLTIGIVASPSDTVCFGDTISFSVAVANAGNPTYQWKQNGANISGAVNAYFSSATLNNNDIITCRATSNLPCQPINFAFSNSLQVHFISFAPPVISITSYPLHYSAGDTVTFFVQSVSGTGNTFQWRKNGVNIPGAITTSYTEYNVSDNDTLCLIVYSHEPCTLPDSSIACMPLSLGVDNRYNPISSIRLYPNPNNGDFTITWSAGIAKEVIINIVNAVGQVVYEERFTSGNGLINKQISTSQLVSGEYLLRFISDGRSEALRFSVEK